MKSLGVALLFAGALFAETPTFSYVRSFPRSVPEYFCVTVSQSGALEYREAPNDPQPLKAQLPESEAASLFELAGKLDHFNTPLESGLKVANTGKKTFRYRNSDGVTSEVTFNYSTNETAQLLLEKAEQIGATERAYLELDRAIHFDKLGVNNALAGIESLWLRKQLAAPQQFLPLLTRVASHETFMHLARDRAARMKDQITALTAGQPGDTPEK